MSAQPLTHPSTTRTINPTLIRMQIKLEQIRFRRTMVPSRDRHGQAMSNLGTLWKLGVNEFYCGQIKNAFNVSVKIMRENCLLYSCTFTAVVEQTQSIQTAGPHIKCCNRLHICIETVKVSPFYFGIALTHRPYRFDRTRIYLVQHRVGHTDP